jgi:lysophospholipase L1-like esterase
MMKKRKVVLLGASITQGRVSYSYAKVLKARHGKSHRFFNYGVAGYESFNVLKNLDRSIRLRPDSVVILVGTNDVMSSLDPKLARISRKLKKIPHEPTLSHYSQNIASIVGNLKDETHAKIALISLPILGEDLWSIENSRIDEYNSELRTIAYNEKVAYLPVNENQKEYLKKETGGRGQRCAKTTQRALESLLMHFLLFRSFDSISARNGFRLLTDGMHLNRIGATIIADEISLFLQGGETDAATQ